MNWILTGLMFGLLETWYFGWSYEPTCRAEEMCDIIAFSMIINGVIIIIVRREIKAYFDKKSG